MNAPNALYQLREASGLTQQELADRIGASQQQVGRLEAGTRQLTQKWLKLLAPALGCTPNDVLGFGDAPPPEPVVDDSLVTVVRMLRGIEVRLERIETLLAATRSPEAKLARLRGHRRNGR